MLQLVDSIQKSTQQSNQKIIQNIINPFFPNFGDISRKSTFESDTEKENENENFEEGKTVNIIIEQKNEFIVDTNIQDLEPKNNNILKNDIDVHQKDIGSYKNLDITL